MQSKTPVSENVPGERYPLNEHEECFAERLLVIQESLMHAGSEQGARLIGITLAQFCRYLMALHGLRRRAKGYALTGDPNQGYELVPSETLSQQPEGQR